MATMPPTTLTMSMIPAIPSDKAMGWAHAFAGVVITLNVIATLIFIGRMWTRSYPVYRMQIDDWIIAVAWVSPLSTKRLVISLINVFAGAR